MGQLMAIGRTVWGSQVPTFKGVEVSLSYIQCFLYLVCSSVNGLCFSYYMTGYLLHTPCILNCFEGMAALRENCKGMWERANEKKVRGIHFLFSICPCLLPTFRKLTERQTFEIQIAFKTLNMHVIGFFITNYFGRRELLLYWYFLWLEYCENFLF